MKPFTLREAGRGLLFGIAYPFFFVGVIVGFLCRAVRLGIKAGENVLEEDQ